MPPTKTEIGKTGTGDVSAKSRLRFSSDSICRESDRAEENVYAIAEHYKAILHLLGEDPDREGLADTPMRAAKAMLFFTKGYDDTIENAVSKVRKQGFCKAQIFYGSRVRKCSICKAQILFPFYFKF